MKLLKKGSGKLKVEARDATGGTAHRWLGEIDCCPYCGRALTGHSYSLLASGVIDKEGRHLLGFFESIKSCDWSNLLKFQRWEPLSDNVELYGILCSSGFVFLVVVRSPFELYENDEILAIETLSEDDSKALLGLAKDKIWKAIH